MLHNLAQHIQKNLPLLEGKKLLIAVSGGIDSVVLTHLLHCLKFSVSIAHCNFNLREKDSDLDEQFVINLGKNLNIKTFTKSFNISEKGSIQVLARNLRYQWFKELMQENAFNYVLTAHHADDNLETFLINLSRGSGLEGLTGIPAINNNIARPLLPFSRQEILDYATTNKLSWREDKSNATTKYTRNKIRHKIAPVLKEINPSFLENFTKTISHLKGSKQIIEDHIETVSLKTTTKENAILKIDITKILTLSNPKAYLYELLKDFNFTDWNVLLKLLSAQSGKKIYSETHLLLKDRNFLLLQKKEVSNDKITRYFITEKDTKITHPISLNLKQVSKSTANTLETIYVDKESLNFPLSVRKWEHGDFFYPTGMTGKKKVSKYFKDKKISLLEKENIWLLCNNNNDIIWVMNHRVDRRFSVTKNTSEILKISF